MIKRYIITDKSDGFIASVYADRFEFAGSNSFNGTRCGHFYRGDEIIASIENARYTVTVGISGVYDPSRGAEQGTPLSVEIGNALNRENAEIARVMGY